MTQEFLFSNAINKLTEDCCQGILGGGINHCECECCVDKRLRDIIIRTCYEHHGDPEGMRDEHHKKRELSEKCAEARKYFEKSKNNGFSWLPFGFKLPPQQEKPMKFAGIWQEPEVQHEEEKKWYLKICKSLSVDNIVDICAVDKDGKIINNLLSIQIPGEGNKGQFLRYGRKNFKNLGFRVNKKLQIYAS